LVTGIAEFSHPLDQSDQVWCHLWLSPFVVNEWQKKMYVRPLRGNVHINQEPPSGGSSLGALEGGIDVVLSKAVM
jgi:hypothetical protein